ncbi:hypothetical protein AL755_10260 [Arthrobacter sp. ERGS1:01]|uniref:carboxyltransferase domain-containing protein n=1 Tax=Arthrobacter sp. ERGS1:01 TaxID=1704044 RepID=UPI0006B5C41C|nr:carboxyltransferase domain-containing protein [Arthrobacter sp. ERGS1:01]ALE05763.1 hypothetical protein AL755_10260 [Arthrobacter sp. ERGS1:01]
MATSTSLAATLAMHEFGDSAMMLTVRDDSQAVRRTVIATVRSALLPRLPFGVRDAVAGLESLLIEFDPWQWRPDNLRRCWG